MYIAIDYSCVPYAFCVAVLAGTCSGALFCRLLLSAATAIIPASTASRAVSRRVRRHVSPTKLLPYSSFQYPAQVLCKHEIFLNFMCELYGKLSDGIDLSIQWLMV